MYCYLFELLKEFVFLLLQRFQLVLQLCQLERYKYKLSLIHSYIHSSPPPPLSLPLSLGNYQRLRAVLGKLATPTQLLDSLVGVSHCYPVLTLHVISILAVCQNTAAEEIAIK